MMFEKRWRLPIVEEMTLQPVVGRLYLVRCVRWRREWWPVIGPSHEDTDLGVPQQHLHLDARFLMSRQLSCWRSDEDRHADPYRMWRVQRLDGSEVFDLRRRRCMRAQPVFPVPTEAGARGSFATHERRHLDVKSDCRTCPHRGMPLTSLPVDAGGGIVCPGHGLRWSAATGRLMRRSLEVLGAT